MHEEPNKIKAVCRCEAWRMCLPERTAMMWAWAGYLDQLKVSAESILLKSGVIRRELTFPFEVHRP